MREFDCKQIKGINKLFSNPMIGFLGLMGCKESYK